VGEALVMSMLNFHDEVVAQDELEGLPNKKHGASDRELRMAQQLIDSLATEWDPTQYKDTYRERVLDMIEQKAKGKAIVQPEETSRPAPVVDLMAALEASLAAAKGESKGSDDGAKPAKKAAAKKTAKSRKKAS
jgi:DNA end-binding protein Ku